MQSHLLRTWTTPENSDTDGSGCGLYDEGPLSLHSAMSVLLETSLGEVVVDLLVGSAPKCCEKSVSPSLSRVDAKYV